VQLRELLGGVEVLELSGDAHVDVADIVLDSRRAHQGALFCCVPGSHFDGHDLAAGAVDAGAVALLTERTVPVPVPQARVRAVREAVGPLASRLHGDPSRDLRVLGVTGTNGKTTTTYLLEAITRAALERSGLIGTSGARIGDEPEPLDFTTPEAPDLQALFARMRDASVRTVAMEVSSHSLAQRRVDGTHFAVGCFTNLSRDHLDFHGSLDAYLAAKARLFDLSERGVVNIGDPAGAELVERAAIPLVSYGASPDAAIRMRDLSSGRDGSSFVIEHGGSEFDVHTPLLGVFNAVNALAAAATALVAGFDERPIAEGIAGMVSVPGRFEQIDGRRGFSVFVDYAHSPGALATALDTARDLTDGRVLAVFGCGGDRDRDKRPEMGAAVGERADVVVLTSDNSRSEDPATIAADAARGLDARGSSYTIELDRRLAIRTALAEARPGDVVMILGKGAEQGQEAAGSVQPFDDRTVAREELEALACS
jgi:UDP-N-acetylmuramoyl-L-alanyl-D-glutamate--2,6-diaminopimelate ligase